MGTSEDDETIGSRERLAVVALADGEGAEADGLELGRVEDQAAVEDERRLVCAGQRGLPRRHARIES